MKGRTACLEIGRLKKVDGTPLYQPERERKVLEAASRPTAGRSAPQAIRRLFERILDEARSVERRVMGDDEKAGSSGR